MPVLGCPKHRLLTLHGQYVGREGNDPRNGHAIGDADAGDVVGLRSPRPLRRLGLQEHSRPHQEGTIPSPPPWISVLVLPLSCSSLFSWSQEFDVVYGPGWQCVVGSSFGCFFTHSLGTFIYFHLETLQFLIFKGASA